MMVYFYRSGFTLIELLVVISIIGILASVILSSLSDSREQAKIASAQVQLKNIHTAMELLYVNTGLYPHKKVSYCPPVDQANNEIALSTPSAGLVASDGTYPNWGGPYIRNVTDPWGTPYYLDEDYRCTSGAVGCNGVNDLGTDSSVLVSCGPNKDISGGAGSSCVYDDDNIVYVFCKK